MSFSNQLKLSKEEIEAISNSNEDISFWTMDLEEENKEDARNWLSEDELYGLVSEIHGGIIGYIHKDHIDDIAGALNIRLLTTENK